MRIIDADELKVEVKKALLFVGDFMAQASVAKVIDDAPTIDQWHYPSRGEYPPLLEYVFCKLTDDTYEVGYYQGQIAGEPEWAFTCFLGDVVAWQYIIPPKEEA